MAYDHVELSFDELRLIIQGKVVFRRCPDCDGSGVYYYTEGSDMPVSQKKYEDAGGSSNIDNGTGRCETCKSVGYVTNDIRL